MKFLLSAVFLCLVFSCPAQDSIIRRLGIHTLYHPYDFFAGVHYERQSLHFRHRVFVSAGMRTALQTRLYPQLGYDFAWTLVKRPLQAGPLVRVQASLLRFNKSAAHEYLYNEELFAGLFVSFGESGSVRFSGGLGPALQQNWSPVRERFVHYFSWNYFGEICWSYAF